MSELCGGIEAYTARPLRARITECCFGFYTPNQVRKLSCMPVTSAQAFDDLQNPVVGGLNDPRLGPTERGEACPTCGLNEMNCTGHMSHIELPLPVYHPLVFDHLFMLCRAQCAHCHALRLGKHKKRLAALKLAMLSGGHWKKVQQLEERLAGLREKTNGAEGGILWEAAVEEFESRLIAASTTTPPTHNGDGKEVGTAGLAAAAAAGKERILTAHEKGLRTRYLKELVKELVHVGKCQACGAHSPTLRKDGYTKIFEKPLAVKYQKQNAAIGIGRNTTSAANSAKASSGGAAALAAADAVNDR